MTRWSMTSSHKTRVCLVSEPGLIQQATLGAVTSLSGVVVVATASGALSATDLVAQLQPDLLLVDANLPDEEIQALLRWVQGHCPALPCVVMTQTSRQRAQVKAWGAHSAIPRASLIDQLELVLSQSMQTSLHEIPS